MTLNGRTALVTGAGSGIGAHCARRLAAAGARVLVLDIRAEAAEAVAAEVGGRAVVVDLADLDAVDAAMSPLRTGAHGGDGVGRNSAGRNTAGQDSAGQDSAGVDIVVNNAGVQHLDLLHEFPPEEFTRILDVTLQAPFRIARALLPGMYQRGWGRFVHITSIRGVRGDVRKGAYVAAKHAVEGLSKTIALEGAPNGVTSNCVAPAWVETPLTHDLSRRQAQIHGTTPERIVREVMLGGAAIKELIDADDVAELVAHLCSADARHITGTSIPLDGGWLAS